MATKTPIMLTAALRYYDSGLSVIPDKPCGKQPDVKWEAFTTQRAHRDTVLHWWQEKPQRNIGIVTGQVSGGLVCLDFDAIPPFQKFCAQFGNLLDTRIHLSGSGKGYHVFYFVSHLPKSEVYETQSGRVEVRANGMQVVVPPSIHPTTKTPYTIYHRGQTAKVKDIKTIVDWLKFETPRPQYEPVASSAPTSICNATRDFVAHGAPTMRNNALFRAACDLAGNATSESQAIAILLPPALKSGTPEGEARRTIHSAYQKPRVPARPPMIAARDYSQSLRMASISDDDLVARLRANSDDFVELLAEYELRQELRREA